MMYVMRLMNGDCVIASAHNEQSARDFADHLGIDDAQPVVSIRELSRFGVRFSPDDQGSLEVHSWDDAALDDILANEYPVLNDAFRRANAVPLMAATGSTESSMLQLKHGYEANTAIIREGLRLERKRLSSEPALKARSAVQK